MEDHSSSQVNVYIGSISVRNEYIYTLLTNLVATGHDKTSTNSQHILH